MKKLMLATVLIYIYILGACAQQAPEATVPSVPKNTVSILPEWIDLRLNGPEEVTLEYGEIFDDPGAEGYYYAGGVEQTAEPVSLKITDGVDYTRLGTYTITYTASCQGLEIQITRTVHIVDTTPPVITLREDPDIYTAPGQTYREEGFTAEDNYDGDLTMQVTSVIENDTVYYTVTDSSGNEGRAERTIVYDDRTPPVLMLAGERNITMVAGQPYPEPGFSAWDNLQGDVTGSVVISGMNPYIAGTYTAVYSVTDAYGNTAQDTRTVTVTPVGQPETVIPEGKVIYLTFDDGPSADTERLLDVLRKYDVKATFFVVAGGFQSSHMGALKKIVDDGHSIGIHSTTHDFALTYGSEAMFYADLYKMQDIIYQYTGVRTTLLRFPGGSSNTASYPYCPGIMTKLVRGVVDQGFQYFDWNVSSGDGGYYGTTETVYQAVTSGVLGRGDNYSLVLQHDSKSYSVDAVERIILWGLENGYTFLPLTPDSPGAHHPVLN